MAFLFLVAAAVAEAGALATLVLVLAFLALVAGAGACGAAGLILEMIWAGVRSVKPMFGTTGLGSRYPIGRPLMLTEGGSSVSD